MARMLAVLVAMAAVAWGTLAVSTAAAVPGASVGRWRLPSNLAQYMGYGFGPGYHAPMVRYPTYEPPQTQRLTLGVRPAIPQYQGGPALGYCTDGRCGWAGGGGASPTPHSMWLPASAGGAYPHYPPSRLPATRRAEPQLSYGGVSPEILPTPSAD